MKYNVYVEDVSIEAVFNRLGGAEGAKKLLRGELVVTPAPKPPLLVPVTTVEVTAARKFVVADKFKSSDAITFYLGDHFRREFLSKVEKKVPAAALTVHKLTKYATSQAIADELGDKAATSLAHLYELLTKQCKGESGPLLVNGYWNIFLVKNAKGELWAVHAYWHGGHWDVNARPMRLQDEWGAERQVFSR